LITLSTQVAQVAEHLYKSAMADDSTEPKDQRVHLMMTASELKAIDDWSFAQRIRGRAEAIRQLIAMGFERWKEREKPK
jgi:hypothetical protein